MGKKDSKGKILIVDDEESMLEFLDIMLTKEGYQVATTGKAETALKALANDEFDIVITDIKMPGISGIDLLKQIRTMDPNITVILITAYASLDSAVSALREGAFDYITKPFEVSQIKYSLARAFENKRLREENRFLRQQVKTLTEDPLDNFVGVSKTIVEIKEFVRKIAPTDSTILITGESGTGKEVLAKAIHKLSPRKSGPFVAINCGALPEQLLESELFGHVKGSFTGAVKDKEGLLATATGGTFFLDEIGTTTPSIQVKLLRALEEREITPVGATRPIKIDVRLIAATNSDLAELVASGVFRDDLYYRLNVFNIHIPALRERREDIIPTANYLLLRFAARTGERVKKLSNKANKVLESYQWKGNVRELENVLERALLLTDGDEITIDSLSEIVKVGSKTAIEDVPQKFFDTDLPSMETIEKAYIYWVLLSCDWKKARAAEILGIDASTLYRKIEKYGLKDLIRE